MIFGQITNRNSLRDLIVIIDAHSNKTYHLGFGKSVTKSNLAKSNEKRNSKIFEEFAYFLNIARRSLFECANILIIFQKRNLVVISHMQIQNFLLIILQKHLVYSLKLLLHTSHA